MHLYTLEGLGDLFVGSCINIMQIMFFQLLAVLKTRVTNKPVEV